MLDTSSDIPYRRLCIVISKLSCRSSLAAATTAGVGGVGGVGVVGGVGGVGGVAAVAAAVPFKGRVNSACNLLSGNNQ